MIFSRYLATSLLLAGLTLPLGGCATLFKGNTDDVTLTTQPTGAYTWVDGAYSGQTPITVRLDSRRDHSIYFRLPGHDDHHLELTRHIRPVWIVLDVLAFGLPAIVDALTQSWLEFRDVMVELSPSAQQPVLIVPETPPIVSQDNVFLLETDNGERELAVSAP